MDLSIFATPEAWISLVTLMFLEIVLGVDNLVFIVLTSDRLPPEKQHIGRKLGLLGAMISRCIFLCFASYRRVGFARCVPLLRFVPCSYDRQAVYYSRSLYQRC